MEENDVTVATVEQGLLDNIQSTLVSANPDDEYMDNMHSAVAAYKHFQDALLVKAQRLTMNS